MRRKEKILLHEEKSCPQKEISSIEKEGYFLEKKRN